jgi:hypothetical protein
VVILSNFNFDENSVNKLKEMLNKGELNDVISQIPPEMIQNFSSMMNNNSNSNNSSDVSKSEDTNNSQSSSKTNSSGNTNLNFNNIDMNTFLKMKSIMEKMNSNNDPRSNLLNSLKPYLRDSRKAKVDQYANLLNFAKIAELLKNDNKEKSDV